MTRDEHRAKCFEAMELATIDWLDCFSPEERNKIITIAFDALNDIARVDPIEATEEMIAKADIYWQSEFPGFPTMADVEGMWRAMAACGDLTNPPEEK